jgi:peroxiredoxin family protein
VVARINGRESTELILNSVLASLEVELAVFVMMYGFVRIEDQKRRRRRGEDERSVQRKKTKSLFSDNHGLIWCLI